MKNAEKNCNFAMWFRHAVRRPWSLSWALQILVFATASFHVAVLAFCRRQAEASNVIQLAAAMLVVAVCALRALGTSDPYFRAAWRQLMGGFVVYVGAQGYFAWSLLWRGTPPRYPSPADFLWMMFAFPLLLVTVKRRSGVGWQWADWLDAAQAFTFFSLLYVLVFSRRATISVSAAYDLQSVALVLSWLIRISGKQTASERVFFRNIGSFLIVYGVLSSVGNRWEQYGLPAHGWVGLCWSFPLLFFCTFVLRQDVQLTRTIDAGKDGTSDLPKHLHGLSALGLSAMSLIAAGTLALQHSVAGLVALVTSFLIFAMRTCIRESQLHLAHSTLEHAVLHDPVTGLANRNRLMLELDHLLPGSATAPGNDVGLLFIDLDRFKIINDGLGHNFGDRLLAEVGRCLATLARAGDLVVRLAGDEFVVLLRDVDLGTAERLANSVVQRFRTPFALEGRVLYVNASVGYAMSRPGRGANELLRDADCAMYAAKRHGKNRAHCFHDGVVDMAEEGLQRETDLREALQQGKIVAYFQPIYSLLNREISGFEALARWERAGQGVVSPSEFVPLAEETGLVIELGKQILYQACRQMQQWNEHFGRNFTVSVNVSARQFADPDLLKNVRQILTETRLPPALLKLELTESILLDGTDVVTANLCAAREMGIGISLDDFLTGYSSLSYLLEYPCDLVKIDRSFVKALDQDSRRAELVRTVVQLGRNLGMRVIAEGVETLDEMRLLEEMGCNLIQGYLISRPLSVAGMAALIERDGRLAHQPGTLSISGRELTAVGAPA